MTRMCASLNFNHTVVLANFRQMFAKHSELIIGVDYDNTPSKYIEHAAIVSHKNHIYLDYEIGELNYQFNARQQSLSPYVHAEFEVTDKLRVNTGLRYDRFSIDYDNKLSVNLTEGEHLRPNSQVVSFSNTSPKLGIIYQFSKQHNSYFSHKYAFRSPTIGELFRPGFSHQSTQLKPVTSVNTELGFRGYFYHGISYEVALYQQDTTDDIISVIHDDNIDVVNAGKTRHRGIEIGVQSHLTDSIHLAFSYAYTEQKYVDFTYFYDDHECHCHRENNFAGNTMAMAPRTNANLHIIYQPTAVPELHTELEILDLGRYYTDPTNSQTYNGYTLVNWHNRYDLNDNMMIYFRINNLTDRRYSTLTENHIGSEHLEYHIGEPRSIFTGIRASF